MIVRLPLLTYQFHKADKHSARKQDLKQFDWSKFKWNSIPKRSKDCKKIFGKKMGALITNSKK